MLSREAVAAALALAGVRSGALVLDLAPAAGLTRAAQAAAGESGRVDQAGPPRQAATRYGYGMAVWADRTADSVVSEAERSQASFAPFARVLFGSSGSLPDLIDRLVHGGWSVLHGSTVPDADPAAGPRSRLALAVARSPAQDAPRD
jgi:hypothetical protein